MTATANLCVSAKLRRYVPGVAIWAALLLTACNRDERAAKELASAQQALAANNLFGAQQALMRATQARDDNAETWLQLGRVQLQMSDFGGAYDSFSRAAELDRGNSDALQTLSDLALMSGRLDEAEDFADQLQLVQPTAPSPINTKGFVSLRRNRPDLALKAADTVLSQSPNDSIGNILKARALEVQGQRAAAIKLLERYLSERPDDPAAAQTLLMLYEHDRNTAGALRIREQQYNANPNDPARHLAYTSALYADGKLAEGRRETLAILEQGVPVGKLSNILSLWLRYGNREEVLADVRRFGADAQGPRRVSYARFLLAADLPGEAEALLQGHADLPVTAANADAVAVFATARDRQGDTATAKRLWDAVLSFDRTHLLALRGRADHYRRTGQYREALADARELVADNPAAPTDRLRLARTYQDMGDRALAESTLWDAFRDIPGNDLLYRSLHRFLVASGRTESLGSLRDQYAEQQRLIAARV
jgi:tetratricopeptide (TPR) repeat protein